MTLEDQQPGADQPIRHKPADMTVGSRDWCSVMARLFGVLASEVRVDGDRVMIAQRAWAIRDGVVLLDSGAVHEGVQWGTAEDVRRSFSEEWGAYGTILPEHDAEFDTYMDLVDLTDLQGAIALDLGCGSGRWGLKLAPHCRAVVCIDFSDAILVARENLRGVPNAVFLRGDLTALPLADDGADFLMSLGVLHHLERPCLVVASELMRLAPSGLFYTYYALDNRPAYYRHLLRAVTALRRAFARIRSEGGRRRVSRAIAVGVYQPLVGLGEVSHRLGLTYPIPLYTTYRGKSVVRIEQDVYDRFFTSIEQRVTRQQISEAFTHHRLTISDREPFWHFLVERR